MIAGLVVSRSEEELTSVSNMDYDRRTVLKGSALGVTPSEWPNWWNGRDLGVAVGVGMIVYARRATLWLI